MKSSDDQSLFAWREEKGSRNAYRGLLAKSPSDFASSGNILSPAIVHTSRPYWWMNAGLRLELPLLPSRVDAGAEIALLNCVNILTGGNVALMLQRLSPDSDQFARIDANILHSWDSTYNRGARVQTVYVRHEFCLPHGHINSRYSGFLVEFEPNAQSWVQIYNVCPNSSWSADEQLIRIPSLNTPCSARAWIAMISLEYNEDISVSHFTLPLCFDCESGRGWFSPPKKVKNAALEAKGGFNELPHTLRLHETVFAVSTAKKLSIQLYPKICKNEPMQSIFVA